MSKLGLYFTHNQREELAKRKKLIAKRLSMRKRRNLHRLEPVGIRLRTACLLTIDAMRERHLARTERAA